MVLVMIGVIVAVTVSQGIVALDDWMNRDES